MCKFGIAELNLVSYDIIYHIAAIFVFVSGLL